MVGGGGCCEVVVEKRLLRAMLVVEVVVVKRLIQNNDSIRKMADSKITARLTRIIPFKHRWGNLSEHRLIGITDLGTFMVSANFHSRNNILL